MKQRNWLSEKSVEKKINDYFLKNTSGSECQSYSLSIKYYIILHLYDLIGYEFIKTNL